MVSIWDLCVLDVEQENCVKIIKANTKLSAADNTAAHAINAPATSAGDQTSSEIDPMVAYSQRNLSATEQSCQAFVRDLDGMISMLDDITAAHIDVTGRTNSLMRNCEDLLERQKSLQDTVRVLQNTIEPFENMEDAAALLGIPTDAYGLPISRRSNSSIDLRGPEFKQLLSKISNGILFLCAHTEIQDCARYGRWLVTLQNRASSIVAREMRELLDGAFKTCEDALARQNPPTKASGAASAEFSPTPLEAHVSYNKFRGLGKRMRELLELLEFSVLQSEAGGHEYALFAAAIPSRDGPSGAYWGRFGGRAADTDSTQISSDVALKDVFEMYIAMRNQLLANLLQSEHKYLEASSNRSVQGGGVSFDLSHYVRQSFSLLLRLIHLEFHLFETLFLTRGHGDRSGRVAVAIADDAKWVSAPNQPVNAVPSLDRQTSGSMDPGGGVAVWSSDSILRDRVGSFVKITDAMCGIISGELRARIIRESSLDALCRIISTLCDDMTAQIAALRLPTAALRRLEVCLTSAVSDGLERLSYCTEVTLRQEIQCFEPLPSQLAYPTILQEIRTSSSKDRATDSESFITLDSISRSWYPPMKSSLAMLSKLYGVIDAGTFEDFASRVVPLCVKLLRNGADKIRRGAGSCGGGPPALLHADLFLVRHLLILREQLTPFDTRFQAIDQRLDFSPTGIAFGAMLKNSKSIFNMDSSNALMQFSQNGVPELRVRQIDVRRELDITLKESCRLLRCSAVTLMLGPLESFLAKVTAFSGIEIPTEQINEFDNGDKNRGLGSSGQLEVLLPGSVRTTLKGQAFIRVERIKTMLDAVMEVAVQKTPEMREMLHLYIDNNVSRAVLVKPIQVEVELTKKKMITVLHSCVDPGQQQRDLLQQLESVVDVVLSELALATANADVKGN